MIMNVLNRAHLILLFLRFTSGQISPKISDGVVAQPGEFPWIVSIREFLYGVEYCSGIIITEDWVLTVASCIDDIRGTGIKILAGEHNLNITEGHEQLVHVVAALQHPDRNKESSGVVRNDLTLLKISPSFLMNDYVQPALLPEAGTITLHQTIAGWGLTFYDGQNNYTETNLLHKAALQQVDDATCSASYPDAFDENVTCSGAVGSPNSGSCWGDAGGPLVCSDNSTCGILSRDDMGACVFGKPTLAIKLFPYLGWIRDTIENYDDGDKYSWAESINSCGDILSSSAGRISYKLGETYGPNEKCVWTIRPTPGLDMTHRFEHYGLEDGDDAWISLARVLDYTGIIYDSDKLDPADTWTSYGEVFFLTFYSGATPSSGTGFSFIFETEFTDTPTNSLVHSHAVITETSEINHPADEWDYKPNELSTWTFTAGELVAWINVTRLDIHGQPGLCREDVLRLYTMGRDAMFYTAAALCGHSDPGREYRADAGVLIAIFKSDNATEGTGFSLQFDKQSRPITTTTTTSTTTTVPTTTTNPTSITEETTQSPTTTTTTMTTTVSTTSTESVTTTTELPITESSTQTTVTSTQKTSEVTCTTPFTTTESENIQPMPSRAGKLSLKYIVLLKLFLIMISVQ